MKRNKKQSVEVARRSRRISVRRAWVLCTVYGLFLVHLFHWKIYGWTLSPLELNEAMFTFEQGVVTIGTILLGLILLSVFVFGRFFCSWGCHILALQDLTGWMLSKCHVRVKPVRSRALPLVAVVALLYMFVWPTAIRLYEGKPWPGLRVLTDETGFGSFTTEYFTRNLPGPIMTITTFIVVGGLIVLFLGTRGFCRFVCPYGALFSAVDRVSPAGIQLVGNCDGCGYCTAACTTHIRVHHEISVHGRVVSPSCLKDLDCVASCPRDALKFGYGKPALFHSFDNFIQPSIRWSWSWFEDIFAGFICLCVMLVTRNLYGEFPFLLALTIGVIYAWGVITTIQLFSNQNLRVGRFQLKRKQRFEQASICWVVCITFITILLFHSGWIRWHEFHGQSAWAAAMRGDQNQSIVAISNLETVIEDGLWRPPYADRMLADLYMKSGEYSNAIPHLIEITNRWPDDIKRQLQLDYAIKRQQRRN